MSIDQMGIFEDYEFCDSLEDVEDMRPGTDPLDDWYEVKDLRDNHDRAYIGLADWQGEFPLVEPTRESLAFEAKFS